MDALGPAATTTVLYNNLGDSDASGTVTANGTGFTVTAGDIANVTTWKPYEAASGALSTSGDSRITIDLGSAQSVNALGLYGCDFGGRTFSLSGSDDSGNATNVTTPLSAQADPDGTTKLLTFTAASRRYWHIVIPTGSAANWEATTIVVGSYVEFAPQRVGFQSPELAQDADFLANISESGVFLGRSVRRQAAKFTLEFPLMKSTTAHSTFKTFYDAVLLQPFFVKWSNTRPAVFAWLDQLPGAGAHVQPGRIGSSMPCRGVTQS